MWQGREHESARFDQPGRQRRHEAPAFQPRLQPPASPVQPAAERRFPHAQPAGRQVVALPLEAAEDERRPKRIGKMSDLFLEGLLGRGGLGSRPVGGDKVELGRNLVLPPPYRTDPRPPCDAAGHPVQPGSDRVALADRPGPADQHQECGLERVLRLVGVAHQAPAHAQDHRPVTVDQDPERVLARGVAAAAEMIQELAVGERAESPGGQERI